MRKRGREGAQKGDRERGRERPGHTHTHTLLVVRRPKIGPAVGLD